MPPNRRRSKLPKPRLQLRLTFLFVGLTALGLLLQYLLFLAALGNAAVEDSGDGTQLVVAAGLLAWRALVPTALVVLPITFAVGVLTMYRVAGPIYRFEKFLESVARGERPRDCRLRRGDQLQELCGLINRATEPLRRSSAPPEPKRELEPAGRGV
ncbi:MAG TPA: hypothetical protein VKE69_06735 [Planctomycetota bacterium]|nr:hypothetical protein [Planctomycetota bacterium]